MIAICVRVRWSRKPLGPEADIGESRSVMRKPVQAPS